MGTRVTIAEAAPYGTTVETGIKFDGGFSIPCTDYLTDAELQVLEDEAALLANDGDGVVQRTVKLQFCSSYRSVADDSDCDAAICNTGASPPSRRACSAFHIDTDDSDATEPYTYQFRGVLAYSCSPFGFVQPQS